MFLCQLLREKFRDFARETGSVGQERVDNVNLVIEQLIDAGHSEAATIAEWKDGLNESWADLLELIDTRMQLLATSYELHKYFYDGTEILGLIQEKQRELPAELGQDAHTAESFHRMHTAFERDIHLLEGQVRLPRCRTSGLLEHRGSGIRLISAAIEHLPAMPLGCLIASCSLLLVVPSQERHGSLGSVFPVVWLAGGYGGLCLPLLGFR